MCSTDEDCLTNATSSSYCILQMAVDDTKIPGFKCCFIKIVSTSTKNSNTAQNSFLKVGNVVRPSKFIINVHPQVFSGVCLGYGIFINFYSKVMKSLASGTYEYVRVFE